MGIAWQEYGNGKARAWQAHVRSMAGAWQAHGKSMASAWQSMAGAWQEHGRRIAVMRIYNMFGAQDAGSPAPAITFCARTRSPIILRLRGGFWYYDGRGGAWGIAGRDGAS